MKRDNIIFDIIEKEHQRQLKNTRTVYRRTVRKVATVCQV